MKSADTVIEHPGMTLHACLAFCVDTVEFICRSINFNSFSSSVEKCSVFAYNRYMADVKHSPAVYGRFKSRVTHCTVGEGYTPGLSPTD